MGKIRLRIQIGNLRTKVTCYVIDNHVSYNVLLGRPWFHEHNIVPSTLHQCFKYVDENREVQKEVADLNLFRGVETYYVDFELHKEEYTKVIMTIDSDEFHNDPDEALIIPVKGRTSCPSSFKS